ncbi:hypothetical protein A1O3_05738 [Capronia epimyces CBS 606.96]|uniref:GST N-terminal domain-containing protein n=1 Tax=Capronia epimyces CBS 606.96 TaxID=1182542 RepID=W9XXU9_9EURO|nr:uncharacterized protein A1O3_05738 [Capronia epimyces CBS 606.96]EXJ85063.1 hypothetical protein A1O3_05738 [Capronia epimyces CBS 606.96]
MDADTLQNFVVPVQPIQFSTYGADTDGQGGPPQDDTAAAAAAAAVGYAPADPADANTQAFGINGGTSTVQTRRQSNSNSNAAKNSNSNLATPTPAARSPQQTRSSVNVQTRSAAATPSRNGIAPSQVQETIPMSLDQDTTANFQAHEEGQQVINLETPIQSAQGSNLVWKNASSAYPNGTPSVNRSSQAPQSQPQAQVYSTSQGLVSSDPWTPHNPTAPQANTPEGATDNINSTNPDAEGNISPAVAANPFSDTFPLNPNPPDLEAWREKLFNIKEPLVLSEEEYLTYFPHVDNVYSHRSTQKYKRKPFVSHYWDCRLKGRPSGTPKSDDPTKKKRKRQARERDLCDVKIKVTEYFSAEEARKMGLTAIGDTSGTSISMNSTTDPALLSISGIDMAAVGDGGGGSGGVGGGELTIVLEDGVNGGGAGVSMNPSDPNFGLLEFPRRRLPEGHPGADGKRWFTIQRVRGNPGGGAVKDKRDSSVNASGLEGEIEDDDSTTAVDPNLDLDHKHTLEESDRIKKNSVQRWLVKQEKEKKRMSKLPTPAATAGTPTTYSSESLSPSFRASGLAFFTARSHAAPVPSKITFFANSFCPFAQRIWIALEVKGVPYQMVEVMPAHLDTSRPPEMLEVNPEGNIPCIRHGNWGVWESGVVLEYLEDLAMGYSLLPLGLPQLRAHCRLWTDHINRKILPSFYSLLLTPPPSPLQHHASLDGDMDMEMSGQAHANAASAAQHSMLISTLQKHITSLVNASHATGPFFLGSEIGFVDVAFAPWIIRLSRVLSYYRGFPRPEVGTRWRQWVDAIESDERIRRTISDENSYHGVYRGVGEDGWDSLISRDGLGPRKAFVELDYAKRAVAQDGFGLGGDVWGRLAEELAVHEKRGSEA